MATPIVTLAAYASPALLLILVNTHLKLPALAQPRAKHPRRIEAECRLPIGRKRNHTAIPMQRFEFMVNDLIRRLLQWHALEVNQVADLPRHAQPDEVLARAGSRNRARLIRRVRPRADDRGVAHPSGHLALQSAGRCARGNVALAVKRH